MILFLYIIMIFSIFALKDSSEIDDDSGNAVEAPVNNVVDKTESKTLEQKVESKTSDQKFLNFEAAGTERPLISAAKSTLSSDFVSSSEAEKKAPAGRGIVNNSTSFTFSVLPAPTNHLEQPPTPTMAAPSPEISAREKEQKAAPIFSFGLKKSPTPALPSTSTSAGVEVGTRSGRQLLVYYSIYWLIVVAKFWFCIVLINGDLLRILCYSSSETVFNCYSCNFYSKFQ